MAYATPIQTAVNSGELSPRMAARVDFDRYRNGCARARNIILLPTGGFTKAPGSRFVNAAKDETKVGRLLPFKFSQDDAYIIEMTEGAARFYRHQARIDAANIGAAIANGTFTANTDDWDDRSTNVGAASVTALGSATSTTDTATYTGLGSALTLPASHKLLVVGIASRKTAPPADAPTAVAVTIVNSAGTALLSAAPLTQIVARQPAAANEGISLWRIRLPHLPAAATWSFDVTFPAAQTAATIVAWELTGTADEESDTDSAEATSTSVAATIDIPANGVALYLGVAGSPAQGQDQTWTGATEAADLSQEANARVTSASETTVAAAPGNGASFASGNSTARSIIAASFRSAGIFHDEVFGRLRLEPVGNGVAWAEQDVATSTLGVVHVLRFKVEGDLGARVKVAVGSSSLGDQLFEETELGLGWHTVEFTPAASPFYVQFKNDMDDPPEPVYIDDVELLDNVPLELTHDYVEAELAGISIRQTRDVLYLFHPDIPTRKIERRGHRSWSIVTVPWMDGPYGPRNPGTDLGAKNLIRNPDFSDGIRYWDDVSDDDSFAEWDAAQRIVVLTSGDSVGEDAEIEQEVATGVSVSTEFLLHFRILGANIFGVEHTLQIGTSSDGTQILSVTDFEQGWHSITFTTSASTIFIRFRRPQASGVPIAGGLGGAYLYRSNARLLELSGTEGSVACTASGHAPFKSTDVGRLIRLTWPGKEPCWGVISDFVSTSVVQVRLRRKAPYATVPTEDWQLGKWSATTGYPATAAFFQSRIVSGGAESSPLDTEFSQTGDLENLRPDSFLAGVSQTQDDDALSYQMAAEEVNDVTWMTGRRKLIVGTTGGVFVAESDGAAITATDISITPHSDVPVKRTAPVAIENAVLMLGSDGRQVFDLGFQLDDDSFVSADLTILASHMLRSPGQEMVMQRRPMQTAWVRRADGRLAVLAYNRKQDIIGWTHRILGGSFASGAPVVESIAAIPGADDNTQVNGSGERDEVWLIVKRTVNGATRRYIEVFEGYYEAPLREDYASEALWEAAVKTHMQDAFFVDCGITYDGSATDTITGLDHLEGQTVKVLAEGRVFAAAVVASGAVTLAEPVTKAQVGLHYDWEFEGLKWPNGTQSGSGVTKQKSMPHIGLVLLDTGAFRLGVVSYDEEEGRTVHPLQALGFLRDGLALDEAIPLFTGEVVRALDGPTRRDVRPYMTGSDPLPFTCLAIVPQMQAGEK